MAKPLRIAAAWLLTVCATNGAFGQTQVGFRATLSSLSTVGVSGVIEITGPNTLRFYNFTYDGRGGGRTELALLRDRDQNTLRNLNLTDSPFQGFDNGARGTVVAGANGQPTFAQVPLDPAFPEFFQVADANNNPFTPPLFPVEFDDNAIAVAQLRGPDPSVDNAPSPFQPFNAEVNLVTDIPGSTFGQDGESLADFAGISVFCVPFGLDFGSGIFTSPADFTNDGVVNAADFTVFRDTIGAEASTATSPPDITEFVPPRTDFSPGPTGDAEFQQARAISTQQFLQAFDDFVAVFDTPGELADANLDGRIDQADFGVFAQQFGTTAAAASPNTSAAIAAFEQLHAAPAEGAFEALLANLTGTSLELPEGGVGPFAPLSSFSTAAAIPEPGAAALLAIGLGGLTARRRRQ